VTRHELNDRLGDIQKRMLASLDKNREWIALQELIKLLRDWSGAK